jgi:hypothetical protein
MRCIVSRRRPPVNAVAVIGKWHKIDCIKREMVVFPDSLLQGLVIYTLLLQPLKPSAFLQHFPNFTKSPPNYGPCIKDFVHHSPASIAISLRSKHTARSRVKA